MIESYFQSVLTLLAASPAKRSADVELDARDEFIGLIRGDVYFLDDSRLHFRELVDTQTEITRCMYAYHYQRADGALVFRYDNAPYHPQLPRFPYHKHVADETRLEASEPRSLEQVLSEIEALLSTG